MSVLSLFATAALLLFLAWRSRKNPLFLAGAAAFLALGRSIYIDIFPGIVVFGVSSFAVTTVDLLFAALAVGWLYARTERRRPRVRLSAAWAGIGILIAAFFMLEIALALAGTGEFHPSYMLSSRDWFYIPVGYFMTLDVLRRFSVEETTEYIGVLSLFTACLMVLYIASALNVPVYPYAKNFTASIGGVTVSREFTAFPLWVGLAWCHYLSQPKKNVWTFVGMALLACGVVLSYTRSLIGFLVVTTVLAVVLLMLRRGRRTQALVLFAACTALAMVVLVVAPVVAPTQFGFLRERIGGSGEARSTIDVSSAQVRIRGFEKARAAGARVDPYFGAGLFDTSAGINGAQYYSPDSDWIGIVYRTGWVGIVVLALPLVVAIWRGTRGFVSGGSSSTAQALLLTGLLATVWYAGMRFFSPMYLWWPTVSLFSVALIAYAAGDPADAAVVLTRSVEPRVGPGGLAGEP